MVSLTSAKIVKKTEKTTFEKTKIEQKKKNYDSSITKNRFRGL